MTPQPSAGAPRRAAGVHTERLERLLARARDGSGARASPRPRPPRGSRADGPNELPQPPRQERLAAAPRAVHEPDRPHAARGGGHRDRRRREPARRAGRSSASATRSPSCSSSRSTRVLGFFQERRAEAALDALAEDADAQRARAARRRGRRSSPPRELVVGRHPRARGGRRRAGRRAAAADDRTSPPRRARSRASRVPVGRTRCAAVADDAPLGDRVDDALRRHQHRARQGARGRRRDGHADRARQAVGAHPPAARPHDAARAEARRASASASSGRASALSALLFVRGLHRRATGAGTSCCSRP